MSFADVRLDNGLRVLVSEDHSAPVFSIAVVYDVGSRNEPPGHTGFAHLFEHLMFKGSRNVGPGEHFTLIFHNGGTMNASTSKDRTLYFETLPANQLDLALFLESDRMRGLEATAESLDNQRLAILEERRRRFENQPHGASNDAVESLAHDDFAYQHPVIGSPEDLASATVAGVATFFKTYYAPNNAVLAVVGDVRTAACLSAVKRYFGSIPRRAPPPPVQVRQAPQTEERRLVLPDPLALVPRVDVAYRVPPAFGPHYDELTVLGTVLGGGRSARLHDRLVRRSHLATSVTVVNAQGRGPGLFRITAIAAPGVPILDVERAIHAEVDRMKTHDIETWEIEKGHAVAKVALLSTLQTSASRAAILAEYALLYDRPGLMTTRAARLAGVTPAAVARAARTYLTAGNRSVVITSPPTGGAGGGL
ncbi:MAG: M16 family metallopeptidase [Vicinamibacterales bacterium]